MQDAYDIYVTWWRDHYGYACPITREAWDEWCQRPRNNAPVSDEQFDIDTERREGWANG
jgi:hypothetical protein